MYLYGGPNTANQGKPMTGHLLASSFHGPAWVTGGPMGPEASAWIFVVIAALFLGLRLRFRRPAADPVGTSGPPVR
jgi:hypothetical protein